MSGEIDRAAERQHETSEVVDTPTASFRPGNLDQTEQFAPNGDAPEALQGVACGRFRIVRSHAKGGLGEVFVADDAEVHRTVALKRILRSRGDDVDTRSRFLREAEITGKLEHPGIVPIYGMGTDADGRPYYAMRFIEGESLRDSLARFHDARRSWKNAGERQLELRKLLQRFLDVCNAVDYAHSRGVIHRDLKPANIMVGKYGETLVVDWGLAKPIGSSDEPEAEASASHVATKQTPAKLELLGDEADPTAMGTAVGTPVYMSPEQASGRHDKLFASTDVYALGAVLYTILTGRPPVKGTSFPDVLERVRTGELEPLPTSIAKPLASICRHALALKPQDRYASARALAEDVEKWLADERVTVHRESHSERARRCVRTHRAAATGAIALTVTALSALIIGLITVNSIQRRNQERQNVLRAEAIVESLMNAGTAQVPILVDSLGEYRTWADPLLRRRLVDAPASARQRLHSALALLPVDATQVGYLRDQMLVAPPEQFAVVRDALLPHRTEITANLWERLEDQATDQDVRLRAAAALALYAPDDSRWSAVGTDVASRLVVQNPLVLGVWTQAFTPVTKFLISPLAEFLADDKKTASERRLIAEIYRAYSLNRPEAFAPLNKVMTEKVIDQALYASIAVMKRKANTRVAMLLMGQSDGVWPLLRHSADPTLRNFLIDGFASSGVDPKILIDRLEGETDISIRRAILLSLGNYGLELLPSGERLAFQAKLLNIYRDDPDPGIHAAAEWLLRQWQAADEAAGIDKALATGKLEANRGWYVNRQGQTMVVVHDPREVSIGNGQNRRKLQVLHRFAIGSKEVTAEQFARFRAPPPPPRLDPPVFPASSAAIVKEKPTNSATWYDATAYCNWLSEQDGISRDQWCYLPNDQGSYAAGMRLVPDYLQRTGYRLPNGVEWELACRAGTDSVYYFGYSHELLDRYAWYSRNSALVGLVGRLKPNDFGLFDTHGSLEEYTQIENATSPFFLTSGDATIGSREELRELTDQTRIMTRGGSFSSYAPNVRSGAGSIGLCGGRSGIYGFRVVRTIAP